LLQDFPFKGHEQALKAMEEHDLVGISYVEGRASKVKPGKPVYRYAFQQLVNGESLPFLNCRGREGQLTSRPSIQIIEPN
jgi:hypothetical protein